MHIYRTYWGVKSKREAKYDGIYFRRKRKSQRQSAFGIYSPFSVVASFFTFHLFFFGLFIYLFCWDTFYGHS